MPRKVAGGASHNVPRRSRLNGMTTSHRPDLEIRLLGGLRAYRSSEPIPLARTRVRHLLVCLVLAPNKPELWTSLIEADAAMRKARSELRKALGPEWIDLRPAFGFSFRPRVDIDELPEEERDAFDHCVGTGDLLPEGDYVDISWIDKRRDEHHRHLANVTRRLIVSASPSDRETLLSQVSRVLPEPMVKALADCTRASQREQSHDLEHELAVLERQLAEHQGRAVRASLDRVVAELVALTARRRVPNRSLLDRVSSQARLCKRLHDIDIDRAVIALADAHTRTGDLHAAGTELQHWLLQPTASAKVFEMAGLLNLRTGFAVAAKDLFSAGLSRAPSPGIALKLREKRDVYALRWQPDPHSPADAEALMKSQAFDHLPDETQAGMYHNLANLTSHPWSAFRRHQRARQLDADASNPHYEFALMRAARQIGRDDIAAQHRVSLDDILPRSQVAWNNYAALELEAGGFLQSARGDPSSPKYRRRLEEADAYYDVALAGWERINEVLSLCSVLLARARIAHALGQSPAAYELGATAERFALTHCPRFMGEAEQLTKVISRQLVPRAKDRADERAAHRAAVLARSLPLPIRVETTDGD